MRPASRVGQAFLSPLGVLLVVVSEPWIRPLLSEEDWLHDVVVFPLGRPILCGEASIAELEDRPGWTRLA